jgi:DNA-3-methyladenine glycosylase I
MDRLAGLNWIAIIYVYAFMQAVGLVNDHTADCFRYHEVSAMA